MENVGFRKKPVLITGNGKLVFSVTVCLLQAGHKITLLTGDTEQALNGINVHLADLKLPGYKKLQQSDLDIIDSATDKTDEDYCMGIAVTNEDLAEKEIIIGKLEKLLSKNAVIAISTESIPLESIQEHAAYPGRILGANWSESAHTTMFLELIANERTDAALVASFSQHAKECWKKDPYIIAGDLGIRSKMLSAIAREAFFLVENGYASIEDIDRACRNDPGYYLSFAGNFRYMDLMGAAGYGEVMKELNPELCKAKQIPEFFSNLIRQGYFGIENNKGFYQYTDGDTAKLNETFRKYSYQIQEIIKKYPFGNSDNDI